MFTQWKKLFFSLSLQKMKGYCESINACYFHTGRNFGGIEGE